MDEIDEIKQRINLLSYIQSVYDLGKQTKSSGGYLFKNCPMCNSNSSKSGDAGHFFVNDSTNSYSSFSGCCKGGSIIDFIMEYYNLDTKEAISKAKEIAGIKDRSGDEKNMYNNKPQNNNINQNQQPTLEEKQKAEFLREQKRQFILDNLKNQSSENKQRVYEYMKKRGISKEIADKYHLFISNNVYEDKSTGTEGTSRLVVPIYYDKEPLSYVARALSNIEGRAKALNSAGSQIPLNIDYITKKIKPEEDKCIYICEGWADALSFEDIGKKGIALHSTQQVNKFKDYINKFMLSASKYIYILCCDNDDAGKKANGELAEYFKEKHIKYQILNIPEQYKDVNEWYVATEDKEQFTKQLNPFKNDTILNYIDTSFLNDVKRMNQYKGRSTGFHNLDFEINGIYPRTICTRCNK